MLADTGLHPTQLELEITESALVADLHLVEQVLGNLRDAGIRISLNDFGTGYSSLYHLRKFRVDSVKIDRSLINSMADDPESAAIVRALVGLGTGLGLTVAAGGVGDAKHCHLLSEDGFQLAQGDFFGQPLDAEAAASLVGRSRIAVAK